MTHRRWTVIHLHLEGKDVFETAYTRLKAGMRVTDIEWETGQDVCIARGQSTTPLLGHPSITCTQPIPLAHLPRKVRRLLTRD